MVANISEADINSVDFVFFGTTFFLVLHSTFRAGLKRQTDQIFVTFFKFFVCRLDWRVELL